MDLQNKRDKWRNKMKAYRDMTREELVELKEVLEQQYKEKMALGLKLDMSRGKPSVAQLDSIMGMMDLLDSRSDYRTEEGFDSRNYGAMDGIFEAKKLMAEIMGTTPEHVVVYGNSSLSIMYDSISRCYTHGVMEGDIPWCKLERVKWLCPVPGYDRHFAITERFGMEMILVPMKEDGPDIDLIERLVAEDDSIKGIWCVPKYSNPQGISYSDQTVKRMAALKPKAKDFRIYWDNAYAVHHLYPDAPVEILDILSECEKAGNPDLVYEFASTSKISFSGAGIAAMAASPANLKEIRDQLRIMTIGYDKINQLRHVRYFKDLKGVQEQMERHAELIRPKFEAVLEILERELGELGIGFWKKPFGGYFISFEAMEGCAKAIVKRCKDAGVIMTDAGATYPYGKDPKDTNIRIAPTFPTLEEIQKAAELFVLCVKLVSVEKLLEQK